MKQLEVSSNEVFTIQSGTTIVCPNPHCGEYVGLIKKNIKAGDRISEDTIEGPQVRFNEKPRCLTCGHYWYIYNDETASGKTFSRIHTGRGWMPEEKRMMEL